MTYLLYLDGDRAVLLEQRGATIVRCAHMYSERSVRGSGTMYPVCPDVEPVEIDEQTFVEAWEQAA